MQEKTSPKPSPERRERFYPVSVVAEILCVSKSFLYFQISAGAIRYVKHGKRCGYRIPASAVDEYVDRLRGAAGAE